MFEQVGDGLPLFVGEIRGVGAFVRHPDSSLYARFIRADGDHEWPSLTYRTGTYGTMLADPDGYLYDTDGTAVTIKGRQVTAAELDAAADDCETGL